MIYSKPKEYSIEDVYTGMRKLGWYEFNTRFVVYAFTDDEKVTIQIHPGMMCDEVLQVGYGGCNGSASIHASTVVFDQMYDAFFDFASDYHDQIGIPSNHATLLQFLYECARITNEAYEKWLCHNQTGVV